MVPSKVEIEVKEGRFQAQGWSYGNPWLRLYLPIAGALQFFVVVAIVELGYWNEEVWGLSLFALFISLVVLGIHDVKITRKSFVKVLEISYVDRREEGGGLELSYRDPSGKGRDSLRVKSVTPRPSRLYRPGFEFPHPVERTVGSMKIRFEGREGGLELGFPSFGEMRMAYAALSGQELSSVEFW